MDHFNHVINVTNSLIDMSVATDPGNWVAKGGVVTGIKVGSEVVSPSEFTKTLQGISQAEGTIQHGLVGIGAGAAMIGAAGVGAGQGIAAGKGAEAIGRNPEVEGKIRTMVILGLGVSESAAIYCLVVAILLLFVF